MLKQNEMTAISIAAREVFLTYGGHTKALAKA